MSQYYKQVLKDLLIKRHFTNTIFTWNSAAIFAPPSIMFNVGGDWWLEPTGSIEDSCEICWPTRGARLPCWPSMMLSCCCCSCACCCCWRCCSSWCWLAASQPGCSWPAQRPCSIRCCWAAFWASAMERRFWSPLAGPPPPITDQAWPSMVRPVWGLADNITSVSNAN